MELRAPRDMSRTRAGHAQRCFSERSPECSQPLQAKSPQTSSQIPGCLIIPLHVIWRHGLLKTGLTHTRVLSIDAHLSSCYKQISLQKFSCKRPQQCSCVHSHIKHNNLAPLQEKDPKDLWGTATFYVKIRNTLYSFSLFTHFCSNQYSQ